MDFLVKEKKIQQQQQVENMILDEKEVQIRQNVFDYEAEMRSKEINRRRVKALTPEKASERLDQLVKIIDGIQTRPENIAYVSGKEMANRILNIFKVYDPEIKKIADVSAEADPRIARIRRLTEKCHDYLEKKTSSDEEIEKVKSQILEQNGDEVSQGLSASVDSTLSPETMQGVQSIDRWMLKHMYDTGFSVFGENNKFAFVSHLLSLTARERLYMYYVIEKKCRHDVKTSDIVESQMSYVPDRKLFTKQIKMSSCRFFRRAAMGRIYWDKLSDAYGHLESVRPAILKYSKIDTNKNKNSRLKRDTVANKYSSLHRDNKTLTIEKSTSFDKLLLKRDELADDRDEKLAFFKEALVDYKKKKLIADKAWIGKKRKKGAAQAAADIAQQRLTELFDADDKVGKLEGIVRQAGHGTLNEAAKDSEGNELQDEGFSRMEEFTDNADRVVSNVGYGFSAIHDPVVEAAKESLENDSKFLGLSEGALNKLSYVNISVLSGLALTNIISASAAIYDLCKNGSEMMGGDLFSAVSDVTSQFLAALESGFTATTTIMDKVTEAAEDAIEVLEQAAGEAVEPIEQAAKIVGITTASVAFTANTISMINNEVNKNYLKKAEHSFKNRKKTDDEEELRKRRFEEKMVEHQKNVLSENSKSKAIEMVSNAALFTSAVTGGVASPIAGGISVGLCIYSTIRDSIVGRRLKRQSVDDYLGIADDNSTILKNAFKNYLNHTKNTKSGESAKERYEKLNKNEQRTFKKHRIELIRNNIREEIMAKLGCASKVSMYNKIMEKYGEILYNGAFLNGEGTIESKELVFNDEQHKPYIDYIRSLGLKIKYKNGELVSPTKETIVTKLQG